jgi:SAM-dependent methyltransferase
MAHQEQIDFCLSVKKLRPELFQWKTVLDLGSLDVNGTNRYLFENCSYCGVDLGAGRNVDIICPADRIQFADESFDFIISTEMLEHDMRWRYTLAKVAKLLKPGGVFLLTCASTGRQEHGTLSQHMSASPLQQSHGLLWAQYYKNLTRADIESVDEFMNAMQPLASNTVTPTFTENVESHDLYFFGQKGKKIA